MWHEEGVQFHSSAREYPRMYFCVGRRLNTVLARRQFPNRETDCLLPVVSMCRWSCDLDINCEGTDSYSNRPRGTLNYHAGFSLWNSKASFMCQERVLLSTMGTSFRQMGILAVIASGW